MNGHAQHGLVFAQQGGGVGDGKVDEWLVVGVFADIGRPGRDVGELGAGVEGGERGVGAQRARGQALDHLRVGQHAAQLFAHDGRGEPAGLRFGQHLTQRHRGRVVVDEKVQHDVGVDHQRHWRVSAHWTPPALRTARLSAFGTAWTTLMPLAGWRQGLAGRSSRSGTGGIRWGRSTSVRGAIP
jgi:hypothetical protein